MSEVLIRTWLRKYIPILLLVGTGIPFLIVYFFEVPQLDTYIADMQGIWVPILSNVAMFVALFNYLKFNLGKIGTRQRGWLWAIYGVALCFLYIALGLYLKPGSVEYYRLYFNTLVACSTSGNGMLLFFLCSAAYRAYRARNLSAGVLLASAFIIIMANAPFGEAIWKGIPKLGEWLLSNPIMAAQRALAITATLGAVVLFIRVYLGYEKGGVPRE